MKRLLRGLNDQNDHVKGNIFAALSNVVPSHLLDTDLLGDLGLVEAFGKDPFIESSDEDAAIPQFL